MLRALCLAVLLFLPIGAFAQCNNPTSGYIPFNCQPGAPPQPGDLVLGGQNSQTVKWTWAQVLNPNGGLLPIATNTTPGIGRPDGVTITASNGIWTAVGGGGGGGVSSVGLVLPGIFTVSGSPVTTSGNLTAALNAVSPNLIFAGPSSGSAAAPTFRALTIADLPSGLAVPGGSTWAVQVNGGAGAFSGQSLGSGQILIGQASGTPLPQSITGGSLSAAGVLTYPASALTGNTLASAILNSSLTGVGTIGTGIWQATPIGSPYGGTGVNNGSKTITLGGSLITTGTGTPTFAMPSGSFAYGFPGGPGNLSYLPSGVTPVNTHCVVWSGSLGAQGDSGGGCGGSVSFSDGLGDGPYAASSVNLLGGILTNPSSGVVTYTPSTPTRIVTSSGGTCASIGVTTAAVCASDAGGIIYVNAPSLTIAVSALSSSYLPAGQSVTVCYQYATGSVAISSANQIIGFTTTGSGPYVATLNAPQNGAMSCIGLQSDGTYLKNIFGVPQSIDFLTIADQTQTGGHIKPGFSISATSGSIAIDCGAADLQYLTDNGAISLSMANNGECTVQVLMGASAAAITPVGATVGANTGDYAMASLPTTVSTYALLKLKQINGIFSYTTQYLAAASSSFGIAAQTASWGAAQTATSGAANMTNAKIIYFGATWNATAAPTVTPTDSSSNTWTALAICTVGGNAVTKIWYSIYPTVSGTQTFTITSTANSFFNAQVLGFSGPASGIAIDGSQACNNAGGAPSVQAGSITPAGAGDVFIFVGNSTDSGAALSIASPFNQTASVASSGGSLGFLMAYFINTGSTAQNPIMTISGGSSEASAAMSAAKP